MEISVNSEPERQEELEMEMEISATGQVISLNLEDSKNIAAKRSGVNVVGGARVTSFLAGRPPCFDAEGNLVPGKPYRLKSGTRSLREIRKLQKTGDLLISKASFRRFVKRICSESLGRNNQRFAKEAVEALQEAAETFLVHVFNVSNKLAINSDRVTVQPKDFNLSVEILTEPWDRDLASNEGNE